jgi:hypothetical protein
MDLTILARITALQSDMKTIEFEVIAAQAQNEVRKAMGFSSEDLEFGYEYFAGKASEMAGISHCLREF